ncbi:hypothetical protein CHGG_06411 [Chaetomium globosum CBS 148.51]|uniref:Uncharacterized protein n=1 Tax=Chaetomium globosum (strain ATCC 6205 / CBS 148.51 / DSM 1962 / NBRC 6347 / NRRL 1970) TaxID=306901 RepID=Q2H4K4_CHAGB|nr:uncharacterized protein CHGG_06411 [Chaetomium globosum CBS 148.51]EAQ89792.1 hypothetical protein CHGG_06411 [Chaetomium globosum CBS 148.51]
MFGSRRHRPPNPPLTAATANPNAATAAAAVFKRHESNPSLPAAAAAAALRARPTTPTRVADVQTKRTVRRSASVASTDLPPVPALPQNLDATSRQTGRGAQQDVQHRKTNSLSLVGSPVRLASQKLASGETPTWFGAAKLGDLGSVRRTDPAMASPPSSPLQSVAGQEDPPDGARPGSQASSINFSYPTRARCSSAASALPPIDSSSAPQTSTKTSQTRPSTADHHPTTRAKQYPRGQVAVPPARRQSASSSSDQALVYDPNSRRMVRQADLRSIQQVQQAVLDASQPLAGPKRKKRTPQRAGSHLAAGTMGRPRSEALNTDPLAKTQPPNPVPSQSHPVQPVVLMSPAPPHETRLDVEEPGAKAIMASLGKEAKEIGQHSAQATVDLPRTNHLTDRTPTSTASDAAQFKVRRQPSVIREGPEPEDAQDEKKTQAAVSDDAVDPAVARRKLQPGVSPDTRTPATPPQNITLPSNPSSKDPTPATVDQRPEMDPIDISEYWKLNPSAAEHGRAAHISRERTHSSSPARQAHFGPILDSLTVKHSPPPRSISPRKSAMKRTSPPCSASPSGDTSEASGSATQEAPVARKKSVRVSFEDNGDGVVEEPASTKQNDSPSAASPLHTNRHSWLPSLGRSREVSSFDEDAVMKPRPALPSFGSVRDRKPRENSPSELERPLVRPRGETKQVSPSSLLPSPPLGSSNDHTVGAVLLNEHDRLKEIAVSSEDASEQREPLPPIVTTVEGSGYFSDGSDSSSMLSSEFEPTQPPSPAPVVEPRPRPVVEPQAALPKEPVDSSVTSPRTETVSPEVAVEHSTASEPHIPEISVSQPTPIVAEGKASGQYFTDVPGAFPDDESDQSTAPEAERLEQATTIAKPVEVTKGTSDNDLPHQPAAQPTATESSSNSDSDIYSDAYEDLSEFEGDGFQSLNAVVESPVQQSPRPATQSETPFRELMGQTTSEETPRSQTEISSATTAVEPQPVELTRDDWEQAKAYWRSLTAEKRAQLEKETREEAGIEGDKDEAHPEIKPKKKKTVERRNSERKTLADHMPQQTAAPQVQDRVMHPDRSYMIKPGEKWTGEEELAISPMRKTMRSEPQQPAPVAPIAGSRLRKSMRANGSGPSNGHVPRAAETRSASQRPESTAVAITPTKTGPHRSATQVEERARPTPRRRGSTGSESSFKRARPTKAQGLSFRHSMRSASPPRTRNENHSSKRFSLRTLSPAGSVSPSRAQMRTTLRDSSAGKKAPTGIRMPSFGLSYGGGKKSGSNISSNKARGSRFSSRLADSSDEEKDKEVESGFQSRFEDSSDDEPVMPIPASLPKSASAPSASTGLPAHSLTKASSVASTALPEELEESEASQDHPNHHGPTPQTQPNPSPINSTLRRTRSGKGQLPPSQTAPSLSRFQPATTVDNITTVTEGRPSRRHSILSVLRHRKKNSSGGGGGGAVGKIGRAEVSESAARRDTRLERSVGQLERIRSRRGGAGEPNEEDEEGEEALPSPQSPQSPGRSPRLQKRGSNNSHHRASSSPTFPLTTTTTTAALTTTLTAAAPDINNMLMSVAEEDGDGHFNPAATLTRRTTASGNLGTRTLGRRSSSGDGGGGFLHRRMSAVNGMPSTAAGGSGGGVGGDVGSVDGGSVAEGSLAGASSTTRRKRFGTLRKMFGLNE